MNPDDYLMRIIGEYGRELENLWDKLPGGMFNPLECLALYAMVRNNKPQHILEVGSLLGKSSALIQQALGYNECGTLTTCDLEDKSKMARRNLGKLFPSNNIEFLSGRIEDNLDKVGDIDFLFIDGPHNAEFMQWCVDNLIPKVPKNKFVLIHDINLSFNWNYRDTPGCETECILKLEVDGKLPLEKVVWFEDWCLNHHLKDLRNVLYEDFPMIGKWGILNSPESASLSIWLKKELDAKN